MDVLVDCTRPDLAAVLETNLTSIIAVDDHHV